MDKFGRNYILTVGVPGGGSLTVTLPFTIEFDVKRDFFSGANTASIRVYNLSEDHRKQIIHDPQDWDLNQNFQIMAGYGNNLSIIAKGKISRAWSVREHDNFVTQIEAYDFWSKTTADDFNLAFPSRSSMKSVLTSIANNLVTPDGLSLGVIGDSFGGNLARANVYSGSSVYHLYSLTGGGFFIDNQKIFCLGTFECIRGDLDVINSKTGLLSTPVRYESFLTFDILFEPRLAIGQLISLESSTMNNFNGYYKVCAIHHQGMISDAVCGKAVTKVSLLYGKNLVEILQ